MEEYLRWVVFAQAEENTEDRSEKKFVYNTMGLKVSYITWNIIMKILVWSKIGWISLNTE